MEGGAHWWTDEAGSLGNLEGGGGDLYQICINFKQKRCLNINQVWAVAEQ